MKRLSTWSLVTLVALLIAPSLRADVKTREKTLFSLEGPLGTVARMFGGSAARDGVTSSVAVKGNRKATVTDTTGRIVDLTEQKVYDIDFKKKEYVVKTFAELRAEMEKAKADAEKRAKQMAPPEKKADEKKPEEPEKQLEFDVDVKETGQHKQLLGRDTRQVILTITGHEKGKKVEEAGGFVMAMDMWLAPKIAALDESAQFELKFMRAAYGETLAGDPRQMAAVMASYPAFQGMASKMQAESGKLQGTPLMTTMTFESVRSAEEMKASQQEGRSGGRSESSDSGSGGGRGLGGMFGRMMNRGGGGGGNDANAGPRVKIMTTTHEMLSVETAVDAADVAIPADFKLKK